MHEGSGSDDAKVREVGFLAVKQLEWRLHLERLMRGPVLEVRHIGDGKPLSASLHRTMAHRVLSTHSGTPIFCGVLAAVNS